MEPKPLPPKKESSDSYSRISEDVISDIYKSTNLISSFNSVLARHSHTGYIKDKTEKKCT